MAEAYIRAVKVQGNVVALALCRYEETRSREYSRHWGDRLYLTCLYPPDMEPSRIRQAARRDWGVAYYERDVEWADPIVAPASDWKPNGEPCSDPIKEATRYWPN